MSFSTLDALTYLDLSGNHFQIFLPCTIWNIEGLTFANFTVSCIMAKPCLLDQPAFPSRHEYPSPLVSLMLQGLVWLLLFIPLALLIEAADILSATENFSKSYIIGDGGFRPVYNALLPEGRIIAVKRLNGGHLNGKREFLAETETIGKEDHQSKDQILCVLAIARLCTHDDPWKRPTMLEVAELLKQAKVYNDVSMFYKTVD
ncbi:unnamed protein product [Fraxinus pennsylvanica]|uniref:Protein kinase domain-containing protein n=1 Tax=Fraxinus pennsylvanica TaxID=56036 RepID=A0AAD1ZVF2_9LAMI|nr:unnamed protein product [Fraxinus pennsylvanica]